MPAALDEIEEVAAGALIGTRGEQISLFLAPSLVISEEELEGILSALA